MSADAGKARATVLGLVLLAGASLAAGNLSGAAEAPAAPAAFDWPDNFLARLEALALLQTLNAELLSHDSATLTLEHWCDTHQLASPARIVAERVAGTEQPATGQQRLELGVAATDTVRYRRVRLRCGSLVLSEADNWYVPARLTADMNRLLDTSDTPFGRVVQALHFQRHTIATTLLWRPLPERWEMGIAARSMATASMATASMATASDNPGRLIAPAAVLQHRALLSLPDGTPFSEVVETYSGNVLAFAPPQILPPSLP
jgi:chorismate-pyruvate lyase